MIAIPYKRSDIEYFARWPWIAAVAGMAIAMSATVAKAQDGRQAFQRCAACHSTTSGQLAGVGPNLNGVIGRPIGRQPGFRYSTAFAKAQGRWTAELLDKFLKNPAQTFPGTRMSIVGIPKAAERKAIIAYITAQAGISR